MGSKDDAAFSNRWPGEEIMPAFRQNMEDLFDKMEVVSLNIMSALEVALEVAPASFTQRITHEQNASEMRLNHYPSVSAYELRQGKKARIWPHYDLGVITLLFQDGACNGLEFEDRSRKGEFQRVESTRHEMVVNVSETLQRWTNDALPAGLHRVQPPTQLAEGTERDMCPERYSLAYFCKADRNTSVGPLPPFLQGQKPSTYEDITALEYHQRRLRSAY